MARQTKHAPLSPAHPVPKAVRMAQHNSSKQWMDIRKRNALNLFKKAATQVPAYKNFLKEHGIDASKIKTWKDFNQIIPTSKADYLRKYPLADLCWHGSLVRPSVFSATSGSTGKPFYFQRSQNLEEEYSGIVELFLKNGQYVPGPNNPTLVIIGFGMGVWIGGMLTYRAYEIASNRGYPVSILPAGVNKPEILGALKELSPQFKQTILIGYPPFIKDILDEAELEGVDLKKLNLRLQFAAESFTEQFRDYLGEKAGITNVVRDTLNIYGTADIGAMAFETPTAILIRRLAMKNTKLFEKIFGDTKKTPTLAQYNPAFMQFETTEKGEILLTGNSAIPLIRYAVGDHGGVKSFEEVKDLLAEEGINLEREARLLGVPLYEFPFVFVYERIDLAVTLYGIQIYPEYIKDVLLSDTSQTCLSGKFQILTQYDQNQNQYLEIHIEKKKGGEEITDSFIQGLSSDIHTALQRKSSEYKELSGHMTDYTFFKLVFHETGDPEYFIPTIKQKWVKK